MPPVGAWPLSFLVIALFGASLHLGTADLHGLRRARRSFALGFVSGLATFVPMIAWTRNIEPGGILAWPLLSGIEAIYIGAFAVLVAPLVGRRWLAVPALAFGHVGAEVVRGSFPSGGFGWGELAYAHVAGSWLRPLARIGGAHLITLAVALLGALLFEAWRQGREATEGLDGSPSDLLAASLPHGQRAMFVFAGVLFTTILATIEPPATDTTADILVVQGNDQEQPQVGGRALDLLIATQMLHLTQAAIGAGPTPDMVVWPESSIDRDPWQPGNEDLLAIVREGAALAQGGLVVGVKLDPPTPRTFRNTLIHVDESGEPVEVYVKRNLVPFGEYLPLRGLLDGIGPLSAVAEDGLPGQLPIQLRPAPGLDVAVAICFETLFGATVRDNVLGGEGTLASLIVAATNDASFGRGSQVDQHIDQSRMRALETGRWVVHAAISGASAFVDPDGTVLDRTALFETATLRRAVPLATGRTPFLVTGDVAGRLGLSALAVLAILALGWPSGRRRAPFPDVPLTDPAKAETK